MGATIGAHLMLHFGVRRSWGHVHVEQRALGGGTARWMNKQADDLIRNGV